ncbi:MAG: anthranilate synthase component I [Phycisphaeraceae bacterium]|nr:anthranilate synthase component I [Phycisphaeraceae bacterium]
MMDVQPDFQTFRQLAAEPGTVIPLFRRLLSDEVTPVLAYRRLVRPDPRTAPSFLFESVVGGDQIGRFSFMGAQPSMAVIARGREMTIRTFDDQGQASSRTMATDDPLSELQRMMDGWKLARLPEKRGRVLPSFTGGWVGYAGYDTVRYLEPDKLNQPPEDDRLLPDLQMHLYPHVVVFDHVQKTLLVITHVTIEAGRDLKEQYEAGVEHLDRLVRRVETAAVSQPGEPELKMASLDLESPPPKLPTSNLGEGGYQEAVKRAKAYIGAGDIFQVVPSQRFDLSTKADPFDIYRVLRVVNPSPYMFYLQAEDAMLVGASPEILCRVEHGVLTNRPLAGTRPRGQSGAEDRELERELLADPKERAEHIMLVDLARNDVGRVVRSGSIELPAVMEIEHYSHVMHISSTVTGRLRDGVSAWDALRYSLPVGTVSGAPKIRAMQIIDELETTRRGPYGGAVGYVDFAGNMDMAIALRTMVIQPDGDQWKVFLQAGAGIVADSDPDAEHQETVNKAAAMAKSVALAEKALLKP